MEVWPEVLKAVTSLKERCYSDLKKLFWKLNHKFCVNSMKIIIDDQLVFVLFYTITNVSLQLKLILKTNLLWKTYNIIDRVLFKLYIFYIISH